MRGLNVRLMLTQVVRRCVVQDALKRSERLVMHTLFVCSWMRFKEELVYMAKSQCRQMILLSIISTYASACFSSAAST